MDNPYQAPDAIVDAPILPSARKWTYRESGMLTRITRATLIASILASLVSIFSDFRQRGFLRYAEAQGMTIDEAWVEMPLDALLMPLGIVAVAISTIVIVAMWIHRMTYNAHALLGASRLKYSPGWTVGWYFVPFANLWKPYQAFKDVWTGSFENGSPRGLAGSGPLPFWWTLWLAYNLISNLVTRMNLSARTFDDEYLAMTVNIVNEIINIPLCLVFLYVVNRLYRRQTELHTATTGSGMPI